MTVIALIHPQATSETLGFIPQWLAMSDAGVPFVDVVNHFYVGSWNSHKGGTLDTSNGDYRYPGDPVMKPYASIMRSQVNEMIFAYPSAFFAVVKITPEALRRALAGEPMPSDLEWDMARLD